MASRDSDDAWDDEPLPGRSAAPFPGVVTAAGVIWIGIGALAIVGTVVSMARGGGNAAAGAPNMSCCPGLVGLAFLICGHQTVNGTATDTRGNGAGSLILGLLQLLLVVGIVFGGLFGDRNGGQREEMMVVAGIVALQGSTLILAGVLALAGRTAYLNWRRENGPKRRRRDEEES